jgi:hypothetical protein
MVIDGQLKALAELVFVGEIVNQAKFAERAAERLKATADDIDPVEVWGAIQSILIAAGNVSKILWPPRKTSAERGEMLRELLDVDDRNPLSDRHFRNHFEHYDERIEDWFAESGSAVCIDSRIDPFDSPWGRNPANFHRGYNPLTKTLTFRGESTDLAAILSALQEIRHKCRYLARP